jgi:hypothetical protein
MQFKTFINQKLPFFVALGLVAMLTSCGSFQYVGYDDDGIYSSSEDYSTDVEQQPVTTTSTNDSDYYKNYFAQSAAELDAVLGESEIFTDIDSYEGNYLERAQDTLEQRPVYGGWGQANDNITINFIDNGWYGWNDPWLWNAGWGWGWNAGWGWNNWGWGRPWGWNAGWGWNNWGWNAGWGWGWNAGWGWGWNNWGWNPGWGYGWNNWGWNGYYGNYGVALNGGRRGSLLGANNFDRRLRSTSALSRRNYSTNRLSRSATGSRINRSNSTIRRDNTRATRSSRSRTIRSTSPSSRSNTRISRPSSSRPSSGTIRSSRSTRSSGSVRSSRSSSSRSSGSVRSSGSSRSSSGSRSSGGRRGRG